MNVRPLREGEMERVHDELWMPFAREMAALDDHDALADDDAAVRESNVAYRRERFADDESHTVVAVPETGEERRPPERADALADPTVGDAAAVVSGTLDDPAAFAGYAFAEVGESPPVFARDDPLYVSELYVRPEYRGDGLADALMTAVEDWGRDEGCERAELHVNARNAAAKALYESRGYEVFMEKRRHEL